MELGSLGKILISSPVNYGLGSVGVLDTIGMNGLRNILSSSPVPEGVNLPFLQAANLIMGPIREISPLPLGSVSRPIPLFSGV